MAGLARHTPAVLCHRCWCRHCGMGVRIAMLQHNRLTPTRNQTFADTDNKKRNNAHHSVTLL